MFEHALNHRIYSALFNRCFAGIFFFEEINITVVYSCFVFAC